MAVNERLYRINNAQNIQSQHKYCNPQVHNVSAINTPNLNDSNFLIRNIIDKKQQILLNQQLKSHKHHNQASIDFDIVEISKDEAKSIINNKQALKRNTSVIQQQNTEKIQNQLSNKQNRSQDLQNNFSHEPNEQFTQSLHDISSLKQLSCTNSALMPNIEMYEQLYKQFTTLKNNNMLTEESVSQLQQALKLKAQEKISTATAIQKIRQNGIQNQQLQSLQRYSFISQNSTVDSQRCKTVNQQILDNTQNDNQQKNENTDGMQPQTQQTGVQSQRMLPPLRLDNSQSTEIHNSDNKIHSVFSSPKLTKEQLAISNQIKTDIQKCIDKSGISKLPNSSQVQDVSHQNDSVSIISTQAVGEKNEIDDEEYYEDDYYEEEYYEEEYQTEHIDTELENAQIVERNE